MTVPARFVSVGAILDEDEVVLSHHVHDGVHVGDVPAHVRHQEHLGARSSGLSVEVLGVHAPFTVALHQHGHGPCMLNHAGNGMEGEGVGEDFVAGLDTGNVEGDEHG